MNPNSPRVCVCQLGARMHYGVARGLQKKHALAHLYTDICAVKGWPRLINAVPRNWQPKPIRRLMGRNPIGIPGDKLTAFTPLGLEYQWRLRKARSTAEEYAVHLQIGKQFCQEVVKKGFKDATHVYTFSSAALEILQAARNAGIHNMIEQFIVPIMIERNIMLQEWANYPGWELPLPAHDEQMEAYAARQRDEWNAADTILVPSAFVASGMKAMGVPASRCTIVPYGVSDGFRSVVRQRRDGALRVLSVGTVGLRKGSQYTMEASRLLRSKMEFRLVGPIVVSESASRELSEHVTLVGQVPRSEIKEHFAWADVFLLPSLCEGMATVLIEALAAGLPIVTTPNAGMPIRDGVEGFIVPIRHPEAIADRLEQLATDRPLLEQMSRNARERSVDYTLDAYGDRLFNAVHSVSHSDDRVAF